MKSYLFLLLLTPTLLLAQDDLLTPKGKACLRLLDQAQERHLPYNGRLIQKQIDDVTAFWQSILGPIGFQPMQLTLFRGQIQTKCGRIDGRKTPIYCAFDGTLYIDLTVFEAGESLSGPQTSAFLAYIVSHEYGHHVQNLKGAFAKAARLFSQHPSIHEKLELQADCLAGMYLNSLINKNNLSAKEMDEIAGRMDSVGDDANRTFFHTPEWDHPGEDRHGTGVQRRGWLLRGLTLKGSDLKNCEPLGVPLLGH